MYLVQITITDIDKDEMVKSESHTCEHYSLSESPDGFVVECGRPSKGGGFGDGTDWGSLAAKGVKLFNGLKAVSERAQATAEPKASASDDDMAGPVVPKTGECCGK